MDIQEKAGTSGTADAADYVVEGATFGQEILEKAKLIKNSAKEDFIYGVTPTSGRGLKTRLNDFLIDHTKISLKEKAYFFHMLAVMVDAGIPLVGAVKSLASNAENLHFKRVLNTVAYNCEHGATLADAMNRFDFIFDESQVGIVQAGEATGRLHTMLMKLAQQLEKQNQLKSKLWGAAFYPLMVLVVLIAVAVGMLMWIFPTLLSILQEGGVTNNNLPFATRALIFLQGTLENYWWAILAVILLFYGIFYVYVHTDYGRAYFDFVKLKIPVVGTLLKKVSTLRFVGMLGLLIDAGLPVIKALKITGNSLKNRIYKLKVQEIINDVRSGSKISESIKDSEFLFAPEVAQMLNVGEVSASLGKISDKISEQYDREIDSTLKKLTAVFEPLMILFVGLFVALLALAVMAPIFNLNNVAGAI